MKQGGVSLDNFSYRICINSCGVRSDIDGMERILKEMENRICALKKAEERLGMKNGQGYNHLITHYARLRMKSEVLRMGFGEKCLQEIKFLLRNQRLTKNMEDSKILHMMSRKRKVLDDEDILGLYPVTINQSRLSLQWWQFSMEVYGVSEARNQDACMVLI
ncbi:hypothetical protein RJT34_14546 [Clitoria ternatea]|uniref:Uncharacterized protein n=1 Tax=Clitoria ternatea TaxID=43366 RepID=A0AAN9PL71_CLITE